MFELADFSAVKPIHHDIAEQEPVQTQAVHSYGAADELDYKYIRPKFEDGEVLTYFKSKRISRTWLQSWMILQGVLLFFQFLLYVEVAGHSSFYDSVVHAACNGDKAGSCKSRLWQVRHDHEYPMDAQGNSVETPINFNFKGNMWFPMSVQVSVIADPPEIHIPYELVLKEKHTGATNTERTFTEFRTTGINSAIVKDESRGKGGIANIVGATDFDASIHLARFPSRFGGRMHMRVSQQLRSVRVIANEMNAVELKIWERNAPNCDVERSWNGVMTKSMSIGSNRLSWIKHCLSISIMASALVTFLVWNWYSGRRSVDGLSFHYLVAAKGAIQDLPLQAIVLWYIFTWYEGGGGEKCQLCLLDIQHCERLSPFHFSNLVLVVAIIASSVSNQFLFSVDPTQLKTEDDHGFVILVRVTLACVCLLPFSTAMVAFNGSLLQVPGFFHTVFFVPCFIGWVGFFFALCFPISTLLEDDEYLAY